MPTTPPPWRLLALANLFWAGNWVVGRALPGWLCQKRHLAWRGGLGILASTAGVLWIVARDEPATLTSFRFHAGDLWILAAVLTWAIYTLRLAYPPAVHPLSFLAAIVLVGALALVRASAWELHHGADFQPTWAAILYTSGCTGLLGFVCGNQGVAALGPAHAGLYIHLMPVFGLLLAAIFLGEHPAWFHLTGVALIFGGILLANRRC